MVAAGPHGLGGQHVGDRLLERRRDVGHRHRLPRPLPRLDPPGDGGLQAGEREVVGRVAGAGQPAREGDRRGVALAGGPVDRRAARERQAEHAGDLVERLPRRVVDGAAQRLDVPAEVGHEQQRAVPARDQQRDRRLGERPVLQLVDGDVRGQVVDPVQRLAQRQRVRLGRGDADQQRAGEPRPRGHRDGVDVVEGRARRRPARGARSGPSPRGARARRSPGRRRRSARARPSTSPGRRRAACARGPDRRRSRRTTSRTRSDQRPGRSRRRSAPRSSSLHAAHARRRLPLGW